LNLLGRFRKAEPVDVTPFIPDGQRVYCVGDIHGRADLLQQLHQMILNDAANFHGKKTIVYLGDYIDRGEQSCQVIEILTSKPLTDFESIYLLGNHEQAMLDFIQRPVKTASWMTFGGRETLNSYGIPLAFIPAVSEMHNLAVQLDECLPDTHRDFLRGCSLCWQCGSYYFVHAGIRPGTPLEQQSFEDQLWIRDDFLNSDKNHDAIIVHGHSIIQTPQMLPNRIGIDTGAFASGVLTALVLEGDDQRLMQTGG
jgi:serine/threonine protein phosphatase 1